MHSVVYTITLLSRLVGCGKHLVQVQLNSASLTLHWSVECGDEINSVDINDKQTYCAVADDTGSVSLIDLKSGKMHKVLLLLVI